MNWPDNSNNTERRISATVMHLRQGLTSLNLGLLDAPCIRLAALSPEPPLSTVSVSSQTLDTATLTAVFQLQWDWEPDAPRSALITGRASLSCFFKTPI
jgi:hypothetical protein